MKRTLRITSLLIALFAFSGLSYAQQRQIPLTVTFTSPTAGQQVAYGANYYCMFNVQNGSTTESLLATDTLIIIFSGEPDFAYSDPDSVMVVMAPAIAPGGSANFPIFLNPNDNTTGSAIEREYCVTMFAQGNFFATGAWRNSSPDPFAPTCIEFSLLSGEAVVSVDENNNSSSFKVYPNPTNNQLNIDSDFVQTSAQIMVHNNMGQRVYESKGQTFRASGSIDTSEWPSGIYLVTITQDGTSLTQRVIVQH